MSGQMFRMDSQLIFGQCPLSEHYQHFFVSLLQYSVQEFYISNSFSLCFTDRIEEADVQTQTDAFLNRPATPLFIPAKTGADVATQIEEGDVSFLTCHLICTCTNHYCSCSILISRLNQS